MFRHTVPTLFAALAGAVLLSGCDRSQQAADGTTAPGAAGTATAAGNGMADTGAGGPGGAGELGPAQVPPGSTINDINRNTPDAQAQGKPNAAAGP